MTLDGAISLNETTSYVFYTVNSATTGQYAVVLPKNIQGTLNMLVDLHWKPIFDSVTNGSKTKEQLVAEVEEEYTKLRIKYADGILVLPMIDENIFQSAIVNSDKQKMFDEVKKIGAITSELYKKLTDSGLEKQKIDQKIVIVEKSQDDGKFVVWLKEQMPNFVEGVLYSSLLEKKDNVVFSTNMNDNQNIFGIPSETKGFVGTVDANSVNSSSNIFDNVATNVMSSSVEANSSIDITPSEKEKINSSIGNADIFGTPSNVQTSSDVSSVDNSNNAGNSLFQNTASDGTTTFSPISDSSVSKMDNMVNSGDEETAVTERASKGFANLLILLVILIGVTIASVELGKFLYSLYGA